MELVLSCSSQGHREHLAHQDVICLVQDHSTLEVLQMALRVRVPLEWSDERCCEHFEGVACSTLSVKGDELTRSTSLRKASSMFPLSWRLWNRSFTSVSTSSARKACSLAQSLLCLGHCWLTFSSTSKDRDGVEVVVNAVSSLAAAPVPGPLRRQGEGGGHGAVRLCCSSSSHMARLLLRSNGGVARRSSSGCAEVAGCCRALAALVGGCWQLQGYIYLFV
ncbi:hypothetical protein L3X38_006196 [Prunus dulcis]|uniref:Uncharacterized protein n=1 Tax=Prunus dulcis TaxID=3755 RepID=A0AAD4ZS72_PRUDU|nr:hypothetical protein L3X38_006196 [Prunus dulcis]